MTAPGNWGQDRRYLREVQYRDPTSVTARAELHRRYATAPVSWVPWVLAQTGLAGGERVVEVGCGPGWLWEPGPARPAGLSLTVTDVSPAMVGVACHRAAVGGASASVAVTGAVADAETLPFAARSFDFAVANHMLYHLRSPETAVAELARVLRPGGRVMAATIGPDHLKELWELRAAVFGGEARSANTGVFGTGNGRAILERHLDDVEWREYEDELHCTGADDVVAYLTSSPPGAEATGDERAALRSEVERRMAAGHGVLVVSKQTGVFLGRTRRR